MTTKEAMDYVVEAGTPVAFIAKNIGRDPTTISKWWHGKTRLSAETEQDLRQEILRLKALWDKINLE